MLALALAGAALWGGCAEDDEAGPAPAGPAVVDDPGPVHVHGLGLNPKDSALFVATHTGLFRASEGERKAKRVENRYQDTMAFTVMGPDRFLGSGHPDGREKLPPYLGLIESKDAGRTWQERSLQGEVDFHALEARGRQVYGYGSDFKTREARFLASEDGGRRWSRLQAPEPLLDLALDPRGTRRLLAAGEQGLHLSRNGGREWRQLEGSPGLLTWPAGGPPYLVGQDGVVQRAADGLRRWQAVGRLDGPPSALAHGPSGELLAALHDGTVKQSRDGGKTWELRSSP